MSMIELMIAMVVLAVGLGALSNLFILASGTDNKNSRGTSAALLAQMMIERRLHPDPGALADPSVRLRAMLTTKAA